MTLTPEQRELWEELEMGEPIVPSAGQTPEQAVNLAVDSFQHACRLEGVPAPEEADIRAALGHE